MSTRQRKQQDILLFVHARILPDRRAVGLDTMRIVRRQTDPPASAGSLAGFVEPLLSRIAGMGMQKSCRKRVVDPLSRSAGEPVAGLPIDAEVLDHCGGVDAPTLLIQRIGLGLG